MSKPPLSHSNYMILGIIGARTVAGKEVRQTLHENDVRMAQGTFSHAMGNLERLGLVTSVDTTKCVAGKTFRGKDYKVTSIGERYLEEAISFYEKMRFRRDQGHYQPRPAGP